MAKDYSVKDILSFMIRIGKEMSPAYGEDSSKYKIAEEGICTAVFDGCGGLGAQQYEAFHRKTGAYVASRKVCEACFQWYDDFLEGNYLLCDDAVAYVGKELKHHFDDILGLCRQYAKKNDTKGQTILLKGSMYRPFPTTAVIQLCDFYQQEFTTAFLWAGDSRGYLLNGNGLMQVTRDDIAGNADALHNLRLDAPLNNVISADGNYVLHSCCLGAELPLLTIVATDGCFDYMPTPIHFEWMLLDTLMKSRGIVQWKESLQDEIEKYAADDFSLIIAGYGYHGMAEIKTAFAARYDFLSAYIDALREDFEGNLQPIWDAYRNNYYRSEP